jgi:DNA-binding NtrC family response regulator
VIAMELPALRERPDDIPALVQSFLAQVSGRRFPGEGRRFEVTQEAMERMLAYQWPGNVRELRNTVERAGSLAEGLVLGVADLLPSSRTNLPPVWVGSAAKFVEEGLPFKEAKQRVIDDFEAAYLKALFDKHGDNVTRSAQAAGLTRYHLRELAKRYGIRGGDVE